MEYLLVFDVLVMGIFENLSVVFDQWIVFLRGAINSDMIISNGKIFWSPIFIRMIYLFRDPIESLNSKFLPEVIIVSFIELLLLFIPVLKNSWSTMKQSMSLLI
jgi:hypothetical protein